MATVLDVTKGIMIIPPRDSDGRTFLNDLPIGTTFYVMNGNWWGKIVDLDGYGQKGIYTPACNGEKYCEIYDDSWNYLDNVRVPLGAFLKSNFKVRPEREQITNRFYNKLI